jgi:hypothetical protein
MNKISFQLKSYEKISLKCVEQLFNCQIFTLNPFKEARNMRWKIEGTISPFLKDNKNTPTIHMVRKSLRVFYSAFGRDEATSSSSSLLSPSVSPSE